MKSLSIVFLSLLLSVQAMATSIVAKDYHGGDKTQVEVSRGLNENGFTRSDLVCFTGDVAGVCALIEKEALNSEKTYSEGEHGYFNVKTCDVSEGSVDLAYDRYSDYGNEEQSLRIEQCR
jgi:hypothetical protein